MAARCGYLLIPVLVLLVCAGCHGPVKGLYPPAPGSPTVDVYIENNHWHNGFAIQHTDLPSALQKKLTRFKDNRYVEIGWGDDGFYRATDGITSGLTMQAVFYSHGSVLHVAGFDAPPEEAFLDTPEDIYRIRLSAAGARRLCEYIDRTFTSASDGSIPELQQGLYGNSAFYRARGHYSGVHTCNQWVADGLRAAGFPVTPMWCGLADTLGWQIRTFGGRYQHDVLVIRRGELVAGVQSSLPTTRPAGS